MRTKKSEWKFVLQPKRSLKSSKSIFVRNKYLSFENHRWTRTTVSYERSRSRSEYSVSLKTVMVGYLFFNFQQIRLWSKLKRGPTSFESSDTTANKLLWRTSIEYIRSCTWSYYFFFIWLNNLTKRLAINENKNDSTWVLVFIDSRKITVFNYDSFLIRFNIENIRVIKVTLYTQSVFAN